VFRVLNRGVGKNQLFLNDQDDLAFERIIADTLEKRPMRVLSYCLITTKSVRAYLSASAWRRLLSTIFAS